MIMAKKCHNHKPQTSPRHRKKGITRQNTIKVKQPALLSSTRWLQNAKLESTLRTTPQNEDLTHNRPLPSTHTHTPHTIESATHNKITTLERTAAETTQVV